MKFTAKEGTVILFGPSGVRYEFSSDPVEIKYEADVKYFESRTDLLESVRPAGPAKKEKPDERSGEEPDEKLGEEKKPQKKSWKKGKKKGR